jgi:hypothetical protein
MRISPLITAVVLAAFAGDYGANARAIPNDLALSSHSVPALSSGGYELDYEKRGALPPPAIPRPQGQTPRVGGGTTGPEELGTPNGEPEALGAPAPNGQGRTPQGGNRGSTNPQVVGTCARLKRWSKLLARVCTPAGANEPLPTVQDIMVVLNNPQGKYIFYAGPGGYTGKATTWINKQNEGSNAAMQGYLKLDQMLPPGYEDKWGGGDANPNVDFWERASEAMAKKSEGTVYVIMPSDTMGQGTAWWKSSVWNRIEYNNLDLGGKVTKLIKINPDNDDQEVLFSKP